MHSSLGQRETPSEKKKNKINKQQKHEVIFNRNLQTEAMSVSGGGEMRSWIPAPLPCRPRADIPQGKGMYDSEVMCKAIKYDNSKAVLP